MNEDRVFFIFRAIFAGYILYSSAVTATEHQGLTNPIFWLASTEIAAAVLLLFRRTQLIATGGLLLIFTIAFVLESIGGAAPARFVYYAASALLVVYLDRTIRPQLRGCTIAA